MRPGAQEALMRMSRPFIVGLAVCLTLGPVGCGGTAPRPKTDAGGAGGASSSGGAGGEGEGGSSGQGGSGAGTTGGTGGLGGAGGSTAGRGGAGGSAGGSGGNATGGNGSQGGAGGMGGSQTGLGDASSDGTASPADAPTGTADTASPSDTPPFDAASSVDAAPATCGNVTCPRLWELVESCRPMGACTQQTAPPMLNRCYANGVKVRVANSTTSTIRATFVRTDGTNCYLMDSPLVPTGMTRTILFKELDDTDVAQTTINGPVITIRCGGGNPQVLTDESCLPPFSLTECTAGICQ